MADANLLRSFLRLPGSKAAIIEFMDFQCPPCRSSWPTMKRLLKENPEIAYRPINLPLDMHPFAFGAAVASEVARQNGKFDIVFDDLFSGATQLDVKSLNRYLSNHQLEPCIGTPRAKQYQVKVRQELAVSRQLRIAATPTIFFLSTDGSLTEVRSFKILSGLAASLRR